ncbi:hypothetical protein [Vitiosangium sp. GDMCC 1.1324]|uniref:hypothetical protein n=1 Tax=Vitiosangium sp. (strain GDMCC 1.1324) TaxID=2138576 RepID=UPI000D3696B5|nr:hypothetical protein [Vitiosangium sp. GDMCC 1.1324]PTL79133.1 hypothetical protein DAT35_36630 [Vitiosangium sp. GDMCC 1.1324]
MRKSGWMLAPLAAAVAVLGGCRSTACEDLAKAYAEVARKSQPCLEHAPLPPFDPTRCEQNLQQCGGEDLDQIDAQIECYRALGTCDPGQKASFLQGITHCDSHVLSNTCEAAIF